MNNKEWWGFFDIGISAKDFGVFNWDTGETDPYSFFFTNKAHDNNSAFKFKIKELALGKFERHFRFISPKASIRTQVKNFKFGVSEKSIKNRSYEFRFEVALSEKEKKSQRVNNKFLVIYRPQEQSYIFAFAKKSQENNTKIYQRVENATDL